MFYAIICEDVPNSLELRMAARPAHLSRLEALQNEGRLILAGPHPAIDSENPGTADFYRQLNCCRVRKSGGRATLGGGRSLPRRQSLF